MRYKNEELIKSWILNFNNNGTNHNGSLRLEEGRLYTYNVLLAYFSNGNLFLNKNRYSNTSSRHRNLVKKYAEYKSINVIEFN